MKEYTIKNISKKRAKFYDRNLGKTNVLEPGAEVKARVIPEDKETFKVVSEETKSKKPKERDE